MIEFVYGFIIASIGWWIVFAWILKYEGRTSTDLVL